MNKITEAQIRNAVESFDFNDFWDQDRVTESLKKYASEDDPTKIDPQGQLLAMLDLSSAFAKELVYLTLCELLIADEIDCTKSE